MSLRTPSIVVSLLLTGIAADTLLAMQLQTRSAYKTPQNWTALSKSP